MNWSGVLGTPVVPLDSGSPKVMDLPAFDGYSDPKKLDVISKIAEQAARDPQLATVAVGIFRQGRVRPRDYRGQATALLRWVQQNIYYVNEPDERLQDPFYTLKVKYGDCDDLAILLYALARSVRLPVKLVISGTTKSGKKVRYHHGDRGFDRSVNWSHIYLMIGDRPYGEPQWAYAEPTLNVPLGWDVVSHTGDILPEMTKTPSYGYAMASAPAPTGYTTFDPGSPLRPSRAPVSPGSYASKPSPSYTPGRMTPPPLPGGYVSGSGGYTPGPMPVAPGVYVDPNTGGYVPGPMPVTPGAYVDPNTGAYVPGPMPVAPGAYVDPNTGAYVPGPMEVTPHVYVDPSTGLQVPPALQAGQTPYAPLRPGQEGIQFGGNVDGVADAVGILVLDRRGRALLLKRAPDREYMPNVWDLPGAKTNPRVPARPQAARILLEETGLKLPVEAFSPLLTAYHPNAGTVIFFVVATDSTDSLVLNPEHVAQRWVGLDEAISDMMVMPYMPLVFTALRRNRGGIMPQYGEADVGKTVGYGLGVVLVAGVAGYLLGQLQLSVKGSR